jgi:hypothetical protein
MKVDRFTTLVTPAPPLPQLDSADGMAIERYLVDLFFHASNVEATLNAGKDRKDQTNYFNRRISEDGTLKADMSVKVNLGSVSLTS